MAHPQGPAPTRAAYWTLAALFGMNLLNFVDRYILAAVLKPMQADAPAGPMGWPAGASDIGSRKSGVRSAQGRRLICRLRNWTRDV